MAIAKVADRATVNDNAAVTTADYALAGMTVGNTLIIRTAADNSGTNGAVRSVTVTNQTGTPIDTGTDTAYQQNTDPGAASAGVTCNVFVALITATSGTVRLTYSGSVVQAGVAEEWSGVQGVTRVVGSPVGASGTASTSLASCADASVASGNVAYGAMAIEGPSSDTITEDADTSNGSWVSLTKAGTSNATADTNMTVTGGYKITTGTGAQTYNPTINNARDSAGIIVELAAAPIVTAVLAAPLGGLTGAVAATPDHPATLAAPLGALTGSMAAAPDRAAALAAPLGAVTGAVAATPVHPATLAAPLGALTASVAATPEHPAVLAGPLGALTGAIAAAPGRAAVLAAPLGSLAAAIAATVQAPGGADEEHQSSGGSKWRGARTRKAPTIRRATGSGRLRLRVTCTVEAGQLTEAFGALDLTPVATASPTRISARGHARSRQTLAASDSRIRAAGLLALAGRTDDPDLWLVLDMPELA